MHHGTASSLASPRNPNRRRTVSRKRRPQRRGTCPDAFEEKRALSPLSRCSRASPIVSHGRALAVGKDATPKSAPGAARKRLLRRRSERQRERKSLGGQAAPRPPTRVLPGFVVCRALRCRRWEIEMSRPPKTIGRRRRGGNGCAAHAFQSSYGGWRASEEQRCALAEPPASFHMLVSPQSGPITARLPPPAFKSFSVLSLLPGSRFLSRWDEVAKQKKVGHQNLRVRIIRSLSHRERTAYCHGELSLYPAAITLGTAAATLQSSAELEGADEHAEGL